MQIFYKDSGERKKLPHHKDILIPEGVKITIPEERTGCKEQRFVVSKPKTIRFRPEIIDFGRLEVWNAAVSPRKFFKLSIRLTEPYVYNLKKIQEEIASTFLNVPKGFARGTNLSDIPGNITPRVMFGTENYILETKRTDETIRLIGVEEDARKRRKPKSFDYWVFDQKSLDEGFVLTVGNENGVEFIRKIKIGSLPEGKDIITAYVRPWFCDHYSL